MPIYQRKSGVWYIDIRAPSGSRIRQSTGTQNKQEAQRLHDKLKYDLWQQEKLDKKPPRLWEEAALRWLHEKQEKKSIQSDIYRLRGLSMFKDVGSVLKSMLHCCPLSRWRGRVRVGGLFKPTTPILAFPRQRGKEQ